MAAIAPHFNFKNYQLAFVCVWVCVSEGGNRNHKYSSGGAACVCVYLWNFPQRRKSKKKLSRTHKQRYIGVCECACSDANCELPSLCFMLRFFGRSEASSSFIVSIDLHSGSRSRSRNSNCNTNPLALPARDCIRVWDREWQGASVFRWKEQSWKINKKQNQNSLEKKLHSQLCLGVI